MTPQTSPTGTGAKERLVIIGGGFGGLNLLKRLDKRRYDITVVDVNNYTSFPPLFYQVASGGLDSSSISFPFRREMQRDFRNGARFHMAEVKAIDFERRLVSTRHGTIPYDRLVIAAGTTNNFFGNPELIKRVYTLKSTTEALRMRNDILDRMERAAITADADERRRLLSFVVVGGGPAGVEVAGALGEMKRYMLPREYPTIDPSEMSIILLEGSDRLLAAMSAKASAHALDYLGKLMVDVRLKHLMKNYEAQCVTLDDGTQLQASMVVWTAGVTGVRFELSGAPEGVVGPGGRFVVDEYNRVAGLDKVYAIGDIAYHASEDWPRGCPQLAQGAIQQGRTLAYNLNKDTWTRPFRYKDKGSMATVGRNLAVADIGSTHWGGMFAWLAWMFIHLVSLLGMRNKITVLINWIWSYFTYGTSMRLIFHTVRYPLRDRWDET